MASTYPEIALTPDLRSLLAGLRWRIRLYIWAEGIALAIIWLGLMFWISFGLDRLPVLLGASEMPPAPRAVLLTMTGLVLAAILSRWLLRRAFVPLGDRSMALLLERRFDRFHDSLVTAVELAAIPSHASSFSRELLIHTTNEAREGADDVRYFRVFNARALTRVVGAAALMIASIVALYAASAATLEQATQRLYLLSDQPWPRAARIEVVGIEVLRPGASSEELPHLDTLYFQNN